MSKINISINLLPPESISEELKKAKFYKIQAIGITVMLLLTFLTSVTAALRILQSRNIAQAKEQVSESQQRVTNLKSTQVSLFVLQNRLTAIEQYFGIPSKQAAMYKLINKLLPASVMINAITVDKTGEVVFQAVVPNAVTLDQLVSNLVDKESNEGSINQVSIESLNRGRDGVYRVGFKIKP